MGLKNIDDIGIDTPLNELDHYDRFHLIPTCQCGHAGEIKLWQSFDYRLCARAVIERGRCGKCGERGAVIAVALEHAAWRHQPVQHRLLWLNGVEINEPHRLFGSPQQLAAARRG